MNGAVSKSVVPLAGDRGFESFSLQRRVNLSPGSTFVGREPRRSARVCAAGLATGSAETRRVVRYLMWQQAARKPVGPDQGGVVVFGSRTRPGLRRLGILVIMATGRTMCSGLSNSANGLYHNSANGLYHGHLGYDRSVRPTQRRNRGRRKRAEKWRIAALYC
jgi:hypothetical protein